MEEKRYVWKQRSEEWIAANPGKPTLYREEVPLVKDDVEVPVLGVGSIVNHVVEASDVPPAPVARVKKESGKDAGVYVIGYGEWCYVGCSGNVPVRIRNHKMKIKKGEETELNSGRFAIDVQKLGIQSFSFAFTRKLPFASKQELLSAQAETMLSVMKSGFKLYNKDVPANVMSSMLNEVKDVSDSEDGD